MRYAKKQSPVKRQCKQCNVTFIVWASLLRHGKRCDFCSRDCWVAFSTVTVTCDFCSKEFNRQRATAGRYLGKNFCSRDCNNKSRRKPGRISIKRLRYGSTEFLNARKKVLERDGMCQICEDTNATSVHHKNWKPYDNRLDNLVLLCKKCHGRFKRCEDWETGKARIVACSDLVGNNESAVEILALCS